MLKKSAPKSLIILKPIRTPPILKSHYSNKLLLIVSGSCPSIDFQVSLLENAVKSQREEQIEEKSLMRDHPIKMLKKSATKAPMRLEPLRAVDSTRAMQQRKSVGDTVTPAVTSITEVSDHVLQDLDDLVKRLNSADTTSMNAQINKICKDLKTYGHILERKDSMQMDRYFVFLRDAAQDNRIDTVCRLRLLEIIELRASGWKGGDGLDFFYKSKLNELEVQNSDPIAVSGPFVSNNGTNSSINSVNRIQPLSSPSAFSPISSLVANPLTTSSSSNSLGPGEVLKSSGKYGKPAKIPSKNYFKDEIVIHNADSGKVLPGAKDRLVQITGPTESAVGYAQQLIEETIVRNTSPVRDRLNPLQTSESSSNIRKVMSSTDGVLRPSIVHSMSMNDATLGEYQYTVNVGHDLIKLSGSKLEVVRTAKLVLEEYFAGDAKRTSHEPLDELFTPSDDEQLSSSPSPTNLTRTPLTRSVSYGGITLSAVSGRETLPSWGERNGHRINKSSRITGRCISHHSVETQEDSDDEDDDDDDEDEEFDGKDCSRKFLIDPGTKIVYKREFLLKCSRSPYSKSTPKCLGKIITDNPTIIKKTPEFFNPATHNPTSIPIEVGNCRNWSQNSRGESQEKDDVD